MPSFNKRLLEFVSPCGVWWRDAAGAAGAMVMQPYWSDSVQSCCRLAAAILIGGPWHCASCEGVVYEA